MGDPAEARPVNRQRRVAVGGLDAGTHQLEWIDHAAHRAARERGVADEPARKGMPGDAAHQQPQRGARVAGVERAGRLAEAAKPASDDAHGIGGA